MAPSIPSLVTAAQERAAAAGFTLACEPEVGALLAVLAAGVAPGGRIVELGTGAGVGTAWLAEGASARVEIFTVDIDADLSVRTAAAEWPANVLFRVGDGAEVLVTELAPADLIFADAPSGKWTRLHDTIAALRPGGTLVVDDMHPAEWMDEDHRRNTEAVARVLLAHPRLVAVDFRWSSGVILATAR